MAKEQMVDKVKRLVSSIDQVRNMGIVAHIDHGKTTLSDSLLAGAGMLSEEKAGEQRFLDTREDEQQRGITIQSANVNMVHEIDGKEFLINLIDTPGHVDFGGDVTRAMRAVDGALVLVDAVEGAMPQTETVLRQALKEGVKPVLFINKVDRLIKELKLQPDKMQDRFVKVIDKVNTLIASFAPPSMKKEWQVKVDTGTVAFGSGIDKWALSVPMMKKKGVTFKDIFDAYATEGQDREESLKELRAKAPLHETVLDMAVKHFPNPKEAQKYRIPILWKGDLDSKEGIALLNTDDKGPMIFCITKVMVDPQAGELAVGRLFSGKIKRGMDAKLIRAISDQRIQQIYVFKGDHKFSIEEVPAGNIVGISGLKNTTSGETVSSIPDITPFEAIKHIFDPVVTKAIEAKNPKDLPKLIIALRDMNKEDPTMRVEINEETGEHLISGLGELHLEIKEHDIEKYRGIPIVTSEPLVVYRETVTKPSQVFEGKSPNKHNKLYFSVEPLEEGVYNAIINGFLSNRKVKKKIPELTKQLIDAGMNKMEARGIAEIYGETVLLDVSKGIVHMREIIEMVMAAYEEMMRAGPIAKEPVSNVKIKLHDAKLHEDAIHRGPGQMIPCVRLGIKAAILNTDYTLLEPIQTIRIDTPTNYMGSCSKIVQARRGQLVNMEDEAGVTVLTAKIPVAEMFGFTNELRSETEGRGVWSLIDSQFEQIPRELLDETVKSIRQRKGMKID